MDMFNWLYGEYKANNVTFEELDEITDDKEGALDMWDNFRRDFSEEEKIEYVQEQVKTFMKYVEKKNCMHDG